MWCESSERDATPRALHGRALVGEGDEPEVDFADAAVADRYDALTVRAAKKLQANATGRHLGVVDVPWETYSFTCATACSRVGKRVIGFSPFSRERLFLVISLESLQEMSTLSERVPTRILWDIKLISR